MNESPPSRSGAPPRWSQRERFRFLERRLTWEGEIQRKDLSERFDITPQQATNDLTLYREAAPGNLEFDASRKIFFAGEGFEPRFVGMDPRQYLTQLLLLADEAISSQDSWVSRIAFFDAIPRLRRKVETEVLRPIVLAIHRGQALQIQYQSMSAPNPSWRWIAPHALGFDGARFHARAWCFQRSRFADFVLARILNTGPQEARPVDAGLDRAWREHFEIQLAPNPSLETGQRRVIELDYGMQEGVLRIPMRLSLTLYYEKHYGLDLPEDQLPPTRRQLVLTNRAELDAARREVGLVEA